MRGVLRCCAVVSMILAWVRPCPAQLHHDTAFGFASLNGGTRGGWGGAIDTVNTFSTLSSRLSSPGPAILFIAGTLSGSVRLTSNKTLLGLPGAILTGSVRIVGCSNVIVRNLSIRGDPCATYDECRAGPDAVGIENSRNIWIDHCSIFDGMDGNLDIVKNSDFVTVSYCRFGYSDPTKEHRFSNLIASSDTDSGAYRISYVCNWWEKNIDQRMPRIRFGQVHIVNNLFTSTRNAYCIGVGHLARPLIEANAFIGVHNPIEIRSEATPSIVQSRGNLFDGTVGDTSAAGTAFSPPYALSTLPAHVIEEHVRKKAGPILMTQTNSRAVSRAPLSVWPRSAVSIFDIRGQSRHRITRASPGVLFSLEGGRISRQLNLGMNDN